MSERIERILKLIEKIDKRNYVIMMTISSVCPITKQDNKYLWGKLERKLKGIVFRYRLKKGGLR